MAVAISSSNQSQTPLFRWKTIDPAYEVRILRSQSDVIVQLFNKSVNTVASEQVFASRIGNLGKCVQKYEKRDREIRLFQNIDPTELEVFVVDLAARKLSVYSWKNCSPERVQALIKTKNPVIEMANQGPTLAMEANHPANRADQWKLLEEQSDVGVVRSKPNGSEEELIRFDKGKGRNEFEDVRVFRIKRGDREDLICELFQRATRTLRTVDLFEENPEHPMAERVKEIQHRNNLVSLTYDHTNALDVISFVDVPPIRFAEGKDLRKISENEIEETMVQYLTGTDERGKKIYSYDVERTSIKRLFDQTDWGRKPIIHIHLVRNSLVSALKPLLSFVESLFNIGNAELYEPDQPIKKTAMENLIFYNPEMIPIEKRIAWEEFKKAFVRCAEVEIRIACDRTWGNIKCDDTSWTMTTAGWGQSLRGGAMQMLGRRPKVLPPRQIIPYSREAIVEYLPEPF